MGNGAHSFDHGRFNFLASLRTGLKRARSLASQLTDIRDEHARENWSQHAIVYQIYPRSFQDTNGDGIGDLEGIIRKLDYLNDGTENSLGVNVLWLNPVYASPQKDFGYDISDFYDIDPIFGDMATFDHLVKEAHKRDIRIIMDFVPNHTSSEHPWFLVSRSARENPKRDWYIWRKGKPDGGPPNNWLSVFGGSAWTLDEKTGEYYMHSFLVDQPDLNWRNPEVREEMARVLRFWLAHGVDGFRTDAVYHLIKDAQFRDDPPNPSYVPGTDDPHDALLHIYSTGQPELYDTANTLCEVIGEWDNTFMVSEAYLKVPEMAKLYRACANNLHAPLNFNLMRLPWNAQKYRTFIEEFDASLSEKDIPNYVFGNHDRPRVASRLGQDGARLAAILLLTLRGMPFIYYGEELGMEDYAMPPEKRRDPWPMQVAGAKVGRDPERTPMQWDDGPRAGFSTGEPWLPVHPDSGKVNVAAQSRDPRSMLSLYRQLIRLRKTHPALVHGRYRSLDLGNIPVFAYLRESGTQRILVLLNFSKQEQKISYLAVSEAIVLCTSSLDRSPGEKVPLRELTLKPSEGYVLLL